MAPRKTNGRQTTPEDSGSEEEQNFTVEKILDMKTLASGKKKYRVKWEGFPESEATWEPEENMLDCEEVMKAFEASRGSTAKAPAKKPATPRGKSGSTATTPASSKKRAAPASAADKAPAKKPRKGAGAAAAAKESDTRKGKASEEDAGADEEDGPAAAAEKEEEREAAESTAEPEGMDGGFDGEDGDGDGDLIYLETSELPEEIAALPSWDGLVELEHMEKNPDDDAELAAGEGKNPMVYLMWSGPESMAGKRSRHTARELFEKASKTLLNYLVSHIKFRERSRT